MPLDVLQPVERRRRRRRRRRGPVLLLLLVAAALAGAAFAATEHWHGHGGTHEAKAAPAARPLRPPTRPRPLTTTPRPLNLLVAGARLRHVFQPRIGARGAILVDAGTGRVLWAQRPHARLLIASTTKIMTAVLALERLPLTRHIQVRRIVTRAALVREGLRTGERPAVWKLLYGLLLYSGNDDALALAIGTSGSRGAFVDLMNEKARQLGLRDTHFTTPSGVVDRGNRSSAWDLAALTRYAMRDPRFRRIVRTRIAHIRWSAPTYEKVYVNKNDLLRTYRGADGVKTGWTTLAGRCLVASAHRHGRRLIVVVLRSPDPYGDSRRLLNFGFRQPSK
jgi:serine-type D-Ala-D-Ala carboxypeptidase (penicillin-binding protein 5/6)